MSDVFPLATIKFPEPDVHAQHPLKHDRNHKKLLTYVLSRVEIGRKHRDILKDRYIKIDREFSTWMKLCAEDRERKRKKDSDGTPIATQIKLPLIYVHLEDMLTYFMRVFAPTRGMYHVVSDKDIQDAANQLVSLMNTHNVHANHYRHLILACMNALKYNLGGIHTFWSRELGNRIVTNDKTGGISVQRDQLLWEGNRVENLCPYNTFMDPRVHPVELYKNGEFCATVKPISFYNMQRKTEDGIYFNTKDLLTDASKNVDQPTPFKYYINPAVAVGLDLKGDDIGGEAGDSTNWLEFFGSEAATEENAFEVVSCYIWLNPYQLNLIPKNRQNRENRNRFEQWRITIINGKKIVETTQMNNVHNWLPFSFTVINDDSMGIAQKSVGEIIDPLQSFASFALNTHIAATRKNIWGLIVYNPDTIPLGDIPDGEVAARIPLGAVGRDKPIENQIWQNSHNLDTKQTTENVDMIMGLLQSFFPTQSLPSQVAGIDRAIKSQVASVVQGANGRQQKAARLIDSSMLRISRFIQYYNILQFQVDTTVRTKIGEEVKIRMNELRDKDLQFLMGQGLKSIDREAAASMMQEILVVLMQNPQAAQGIDILGMIDYVGDLQGVEINVSEFRLDQQPQGQQPPAAGAAAPTDENPGTPDQGAAVSQGDVQ